MLIKSSYLNDLSTFPALSKHWALFPIVNIKRFLIKSFIISPTESACLLFRTSLWLVLLSLRCTPLPWDRRMLNSCSTFPLVEIWILIFWQNLFVSSLLLLRSRFGSLGFLTSTLWLNICYNSFFWLSFLLLNGYSISTIYFSESRF